MKKIFLVFAAIVMLMCIGCSPNRNDNNIETTPNVTENPGATAPSVMPTQDAGDVIDDALDSLETVMPELVPSDGSGDYDAEADGDVEDDTDASAKPSAESSAKIPEK